METGVGSMSMNTILIIVGVVAFILMDIVILAVVLGNRRPKADKDGEA